jgi:hypothetical protein
MYCTSGTLESKVTKINSVRWEIKDNKEDEYLKVAPASSK